MSSRHRWNIRDLDRNDSLEINEISKRSDGYQKFYLYSTREVAQIFLDNKREKSLLAGTDPVALDAVGLKIIQAKRDELRGEPWPISPPPICLEAADKVYKLGNSRLENIEIRTIGWNQDLLL